MFVAIALHDLSQPCYVDVVVICNLGHGSGLDLFLVLQEDTIRSLSCSQDGVEDGFTVSIAVKHSLSCERKITGRLRGVVHAKGQLGSSHSRS